MLQNLYKKYFIKIGTTKFIKISLVLFLLYFFINPFRIIAIAMHIGIALFHFVWHIAIKSAIEKRKMKRMIYKKGGRAKRNKAITKIRNTNLALQ